MSLENTFLSFKCDHGKLCESLFYYTTTWSYHTKPILTCLHAVNYILCLKAERLCCGMMYGVHKDAHCSVGFWDYALAGVCWVGKKYIVEMRKEIWTLCSVVYSLISRGLFTLKEKQLKIQWKICNNKHFIKWSYWYLWLNSIKQQDNWQIRSLKQYENDYEPMGVASCHLP
jgi:hypothetical protein